MNRTLITMILFLMAAGLLSFRMESLPSGEPVSAVQQRLFELTKGHDHPPMNEVGGRTVVNFWQLPDSQKNCGGLCFKIAKERVNKAFQQVTGKGLYEWLPSTMATAYLSPRQVFDWTWNINSQDNEIWRSIPNIRATGSAGALQMAKLGTIKDEKMIWKGELKPGAVVQTFVYASDFMKVLKGINNPSEENNLSSYGHSFIFLEYVRDENEEIIGMRVADQGFLNNVVVTQEDFQSWWGANILDPATNP